MLEGEASRLKDLGSIEIQVAHKRIVGKSAPKDRPSATGPGIVSEKALKGQSLSHSTKYGINIYSSLTS